MSQTETKNRFWQRLNAADRKLFIRIMALAILGITLMYGSGFFNTEQDDLAVNTPIANSEQAIISDDMEAKLLRIIEAIDGVGAVEVALTYSQSSSYEYAVNSQTSTNISDDTDNDNQNISTANQSDQSLTIAEINSQPILLKENMPLVNGAVIVAVGAENSQIREKIYLATQTLTGLSLNRIQVLAAEN